MTDTRLLMDGDTLIEHRSADVEPVLDHARALRQTGASGTGDMRHAAKFPPVLIEQYMTLHGIDFNEFLNNPEHVLRMLRDPELSGFRVWQGRV